MRVVFVCSRWRTGDWRCGQAPAWGVSPSLICRAPWEVLETCQNFQLFWGGFPTSQVSVCRSGGAGRHGRALPAQPLHAFLGCKVQTRHGTRAVQVGSVSSRPCTYDDARTPRTSGARHGLQGCTLWRPELPKLAADTQAARLAGDACRGRPACHPRECVL